MTIAFSIDEQLQGCPICDHPMRIQHDGLFDDRYGYPGMYSLLTCDNCGLIRTWPKLDDEDLPGLYIGYYPRRHIDAQALARQLQAPHSVLGRLKIWLRGIGNQGHFFARPGMNVLDYGCGAGGSLLEVRKLGADGYGVEVDTNVRQVADLYGLNIHIGTLSDAPFEGIEFDLISLNQVIEHVTEPANLLSALAERLRARGILVVSFPNVGSIYRRLFGRRWINWHVPYHQLHFNRHSFEALCSRAGLQVTHWKTVTPNVWTVMQLQSLFASQTPGAANPLWSSAVGGESLTARPAPHRKVLRRLVRLARWLARAPVGVVIVVFNRLIDVLGMGDSLVVFIQPAECSVQAEP